MNYEDLEAIQDINKLELNSKLKGRLRQKFRNKFDSECETLKSFLTLRFRATEEAKIEGDKWNLMDEERKKTYASVSNIYQEMMDKKALEKVFGNEKLHQYYVNIINIIYRYAKKHHDLKIEVNNWRTEKPYTPDEITFYEFEEIYYQMRHVFHLIWEYIDGVKAMEELKEVIKEFPELKVMKNEQKEMESL